ncbi:19251_t:CDS:2 [Funneliformis geosporum]|uniref:172_t:CDS:1 n=1 Tax=Funneliformis geosporum TaxID=1117311 RepID=A0A9W4SIC5_9GLOM|nr:19251_t:CDS:2 [Funneliformis geosporum]CAI2170156.1 172_t:CDS:2 [Funneliformis geosporum]
MDWSPTKSESSLPSPLRSRSRSGSPPSSSARTVTINLFPLSDSIEFAPKHLSFNPDQEIKVGRVSGSRNQKEARADNGVFSCDVMSREHALLKEENGKILIKDLKSTHGTFINTVRLGDGSDESDWRILNHGDVITFGHSVRRNQNLYKHLSAYIFYPKETKDETLPPNKFNGVTSNALPIPSPPTFIKTERSSENVPTPLSGVAKEPVTVASAGISQQRSEGPASYYIAKSGGLPPASSNVTNPLGNKFGGLPVKPRITDNATHASEVPVTEPKQHIKQEVGITSSTSEEMLTSIQKLKIGQSDDKTHIEVENKEQIAQTAKSDQDSVNAFTENDEIVDNLKNVEKLHKSVSSESFDEVESVEVTGESAVIRTSVSATRTTVSFAAPAPVKERLSTQSTRETKPSKVSRREKENSREKDSHREKENYREKESHNREKESHSREKEIRNREKESHSREKEAHREKENYREKEFHSREKEGHREKESHKERDNHKEKESHIEKEWECLKEIESNTEKESNTDTDKCENVSNGEGPSHVTEDDTSNVATAIILRKRKYEEIDEELIGPSEIIALKNKLAELEERAIHVNKRRKWELVYSTVVGMAAGALSVGCAFMLGVAFYYRKFILSYFPSINRRYQRLPTVFSSNSFQNDIEDGLTSETFDLEQNIIDGDSRPGLEDSDEIKRIMETEHVTFDQARLIRQKRKFQTNNIDPQTGLPRDPKLVTFS